MKTDYEPIDLSSFCNGGKDVFRFPRAPKGSHLYIPDGPPPVGEQSFYGLPFQIGSKNETSEKCLIVFGKGNKQSSVAIPIGKRAPYIIFAHTLLETRLWEGGPLGEIVARYIFHFNDGQILEVPVRERFEVGNLPLPWGQYPFLAVPDEKPHMEPRYRGEWEQMGFRLTETSQGWPRAYYLWAWKNPHPKRVIQKIEVEPTEYKFVLAAITLGYLEEQPIVRTSRRPVKITLAQEEDANQPFNLEVKVDRGYATYPYPLPDSPLDELDPSMKGFGAPINEKSSPAYTEVAATPSANVTIMQGENVIGQVNWGELGQQSVIDTPKIRLEIVDPGKNWVHVRVIDDDTGEPLPCRIAFHSPEGVPYPPHGHHAPVFSNFHDWNMDVGGDAQLGLIAYAYIDGQCQGWLPRGRVLVDAARGFEYEPTRTWVNIKPGQQHLTLRLKRWIDMGAQRYFSGDTHVHFLSTQGSLLEAVAEELNVVNLLQSQWGHYFSNKEDFTGQPNVSKDGKTIVFTSQENRQHILGHLSLLGLKEPVMPWGSGGPSEAELGGNLEITMSQWADACHAQGGTVVIPHLPTPNGEPAALIATGRADAVEMLEHLEYEHLEYYRYLNGGYKLPLVGGTDKMSSHVPVGLYRTYVHIPSDEEFNYENWCKHLRKGHTFLSSGPLIWFSVEGQPVGSTLKIRGGGEVEVEARVRSIFPIHTLQIVQEGNVVAEASEESGARALHLHTRLQVQRDTWLTARCGGPNYTVIPHFDRRKRGIMAHTSPIYITCTENYSLCDPATFQYMLTLVEGGLAYIRQRSPQYPEDHVTHHHRQNNHLSYLEAPFHEAREAIHRRMHQLGLSH